MKRYPFRFLSICLSASYAPYISDAAILKLSPSYTTGEPVILYRPASDPRKQKDLCVSPALYDKTSSDSQLPPVPGTIHLDGAREALLLLPQTINEPSHSGNPGPDETIEK